MNHQNTKISENGIFERCVFSRSFAPLNRNIFFLIPKIDENGIFGPKNGQKRVKNGKNEEFLKKEASHQKLHPTI